MRQRPLVHVFLATSLDGYIAGPDDDLEWLLPFSSDPPERTGYSALMARVDALVMGRRTFDAVLDFDPWPYPDHRVVVMSHRPIEDGRAQRAPETALADLLQRLHAEGVREVYLDGGQIVRQGLAAGLVDTLTLSVAPVLLGEGVPLFGPGLGGGWAADSAEVLPSGLVQTRYRRRCGG